MSLIGDQTFLTLVTILCCFCCGVVTSQRIVTPPPPGRDPVEANGRLYNLHYVPQQCKDPIIFAQSTLGTTVISDAKVLMEKYGPYEISGNLQIAPSGCLVVMPGTELFFNPGFGILVNGTLIARGSYLPGGRILMTKNPNATLEIGPSAPWPTDARLVDGNTTRDGRLDLYYRSKWRGVCTNYNNFTAIDLNVTCRHLGFVYGNFTYHSFARNETDYMLYEKPACKGGENSLFDCPGSSGIKYGARICDGQQVIGFSCVGLRPDLARDHWRGIEFYNATTSMKAEDQNLYYNDTMSHLEYLDISYAGLDIYRGDGLRHGFGTISASPYVPVMNNITISNGAYDALNLTDIKGPIHIANSSITDNRGHGVFIHTAVGRTLINKTDILNNWGDGIKMYMSNYTINRFDKDFPFDASFCKTGSPYNPSFPVLLHQDIVSNIGDKPIGSSCEKTYQTVANQMITLHVLILERDPDASGTFTVRDGGRNGSDILNVPINNGTFPQSITTKSNVIFMRFDYSVPPEPPSGVDKRKRCKHMQSCIRWLLELTTNKGPDSELRLFNTSISSNNGYGVNLQDMRSKVHLNSSVISNNGYGAGLRIYQGAGEVAVNNTVIERNQQSGVNITYSGGYQLFNLTTVSENFGYGVITEYLRLNRTRLESMQKIEVVKSYFILNKWTAFRIGNYCMGGEYLFNQSFFSFNMHEAIEYLSCNISTRVSTNFSMAFNTFEGNKRHAVLISPVVNTVGIFTNNTFTNHSIGVIRMNNGYDFVENRWYKDFEVDYRIYENQFKDNTGRYVVNFRLTETSPFQKLDFLFNDVVENRIQESFRYLNPRSKANAPIIVSSGNIKVQRNFIFNPESVRDIATHLIDPSVIILANLNWWNTQDHATVYSRLFDQNSRFNLAELEYYPVLKDRWLYGDKNTNQEPKYRWQFARSSLIGGVLDGNFTTNPQTYHVDRDIFILKDSVLEILPGTTFEFEPSIGMVVHGRLIADGDKYANGRPQRIRFDLYDYDTLPLENRTSYESLRLVDGADQYEGRLELNISGEVGLVCNDGWTEQNSAVACQQMGLTFNPNYGRTAQTVFDLDKPVLRSRVDCDLLDTDVRECKAEMPGQFICQQTHVVFLRCQSPTWSGMTIPAMPRFGLTFETQIRHLTINRAGLLDWAAMSYTPGFRIDYNFYSISWLTVSNCVSDGINIKYSNPYSRNLIEHLVIENNMGNGFLTRSPFLQLSHVNLTNNDRAGFVYDPMFTEYEALSVRNFIYRNRTVPITNFRNGVKRLEDNKMIFIIEDNKMIFITCPRSDGVEDTSYIVEIQTSDSFRVTVQVLDYNPLTEIEQVTFYDSGRSGISGSHIKTWSIERDLVDFPIVSGSPVLTIKFHVKGVRSGRLALAIISSGATEKYVSRIKVYNATIDNNERGIVTKHYNNPSNEKMEIFHRAKHEEIYFEQLWVKNSRMEAMFIPSLTKYHENFIPSFEEMTQPERVGAIVYTIIYAKFIDNKKGIHAEHNHVDFANNVWKWNVSYAEITGCSSGGFEIELPRVNEEFHKHAVVFTQSRCVNNQDFAFGVLGYYANVTISLNTFLDNMCRTGLITLNGMEKDLVFKYNMLENNYGKYMVDFDLGSHSEFSENVQGIAERNVIKYNKYARVSSGLGTTNHPKTFAVAIKGVQKMFFHRNIFLNAELQFEFVAGVTALKLDNTLNVEENYWGTTDPYGIKERIFDFDDWNNYAIADFTPFLSIPDMDGDLSRDEEINIEWNRNNRLGGRVWRNDILAVRNEPYLVYSDLTIMPNVRLTIQPGTTLQFYPNVGILVLGQLVATGLPMSRIRFMPIDPTESSISLPLTSPQQSLLIRLKGGLLENEGFLELYNSSSRSWNLMCDSQFNEKTAEVVCRELGLDTVNVDVRFTHLYDYYVYGKPQYFLKEFWTYAYYCTGEEDELNHCLKRINYHIKPCIFAANYTFIRCGERNLPPPYNYWGNLRFAQPNYEEKVVDYIRDEDRSILQYIDIDGAGMLHGEKVGAIQTTYVSPIMNNLNITRSVSNGIDVVAPRHNVEIVHQNISGNLGYGVNVLVLNGDSTKSIESSFIPLVTNTVPYNLYGLVDICRMEKEIVVENRLILFYKYSQRAVDCVKIIHGLSSIGPKNVALRFLQFSLFHDDFYRNHIEVFDGKMISEYNQLAALNANSTDQEIKRKYASTNNVLTIHIHASPSYGFYGFIAEVVTIPLSGLTYPDENVFHHLNQVVMQGNQDGAVLYNGVGEITPSFIMNHCWLENNGVAILNLTSPPVINIGLQSTKIFNLQNSFIARNKGGTYISATTPSAATKLRANITNNVFAYNTNGEVLNMTGHHYEKFLLYENYIFNNTAGDYRDTIHVQNIVVNFTYNTVTNNTGHYVVRLYNTEKTEAVQEYTKNLFHQNNATALYRALFHVGSGNPKINHNYMVNLECDFELESNPSLVLDSGMPGYNTPIDARNNWWGSPSTSYVNGKIWDKLDNSSLVAVDYMPIKINNGSLVIGKCAPGWFLDSNRCYKYMGAALPYREANLFCMENNGFLAESKDRQEFLKYLLKLTMNVYDERQRVWVYSEVGSGKCSAFERNYVVEEYDCFYTMHPFICEKDPYIEKPDSSIYIAVIGIAAGIFGLAVVIVVILAILWRAKSSKRKKERFERQSSIRSSIRGSTIRTRSTMSVFTDGYNKRRLDQLSVSSSRYDLDQKSLGASQISLGGVTEDESHTDSQKMRHQLRQRAEIARGRPENHSPQYDQFEGRSNGFAGRPYRGREYSEEGSEVEERDDRRRPPPSRYHQNGAYKTSEESRNYSEHSEEEEEEYDSEEDVKKKLTDDDDEEDHRNSFTPVKFLPRSEKELDSIQMAGDASVQYVKDEDESGSIDLGTGGRHLSRQMSSFSQPDNPSRPDPRDRYNVDPQDRYNVDPEPVPTPPAPLPMNIPMKPVTPVKPVQPPSVRPVPAPRPKPIPSTRSFGSKENITDTEEKMNNLSQDELSDRYNSRERLDRGGMYDRKMASSREKMTDIPPASPYRPDVGVGAGIDFLPRPGADKSAFDGGRDSPIHQSREKLLPKQKDDFDNRPPQDSGRQQNRYMPDPYEPNINSDNERLWPNKSAEPWRDESGRNTPQNTDYSDGAGVDYLPRTPVSPATPSAYNSGYQQSPQKPYPPTTPRHLSSTDNYSPGYNQQPPSYSYPDNSYQGDRYDPDTGVDYLPRSMNTYSMGASKPNMSRSRENLSRSRENLKNAERENISRSRENLSRSRENLSKSRENMSRSREYLSRSRDNIAGYNDVRNNSTDVKKPRPQKSIETEI